MRRKYLLWLGESAGRKGEMGYGIMDHDHAINGCLWSQIKGDNRWEKVIETFEV